MTDANIYDIAIIGDGITGLSAAYHLQRLGFPRLCVFAGDLEKSATSNSAGLISGAMADNYTRLTHHFGRSLTKNLWTFANFSFDHLIQYCQEHEVPYYQGNKLRWVDSKAEAHEAIQAIAQLQSDGFKAQWQESAALVPTISPGPSFEGTQFEDQRAACLNVQELTKSLRNSLSPVIIQSKVHKLTNHNGEIQLDHQKGVSKAEYVICAQHLAISDLIPELQGALVSFADQWSEFELRDSTARWPWPVGSVFSWNFGYQWGVLTSPRHVRLGGARFLRKFAGIEASSALYDASITQYLQNAWQKLWPGLPLQKSAEGRAVLDCRPCDELPIIGPMFGQSRILLATGYMGQGLALGFLAGRCLAELIAGQETLLPRFLWPERLRSLPQQKDGD